MELRKRAGGQPGGSGPGLLGINARYFAIRAVLFGVVLAVVLLLGLGGLLAFVLALAVSGLLSYPLALRQRRAVIDVMENRRGGRS
ncbi:conserved hypothetical protein [Frankia canadensis]|uniref:DUF4229 domain-containing protein n=1 Tax=Frankia canadensis TaxID=1836972 RepID=A0A2I2KSK2_9ACTN|nr:hypothetical protein [Frankia canadensis]SNQ48651.1 conserved hypothetical protein [Frankia canadensis]SOU55941.1 conserved hypothetical protein [Frankia canadensis]